MNNLRVRKKLNSDTEAIKFVGLPKLSLSIATDESEVFVVGCSHSSVQNIIQETKEYTRNQINLLYGGYHKLPYGRNEINSVTYQLNNDFGVNKIAPAHCTGHLAFKILRDTYGDNYVFAGLGERIKIETGSNE